MKNSVKWLILVVGVAGAVAIVYNKWQSTQPVVQTQPVAPVEPAPPPVAKAEPPPIRYPVGDAATAQAKPLPALPESDSVAQASVAGLVGQKPFADFFQSSDIARRIVATVDNLAREKVALRLMPVKPVPGRFATTREGENLVISPDNASRYTPYVRLMEAVDAKKLGVTYVQFYPLLQQAYKELGYPKGYFNDRLVEVIDHLLAAPDIKGPIKLVRPKVMYEFADSELEALSAGQKIMIRMGSENAAKVKAKLKEIRNELTSQATK
jgi:Protein of unknown function (DUF3014)